MATLDELMRAKGVIAAGEFTDDGRICRPESVLLTQRFKRH